MGMGTDHRTESRRSITLSTMEHFPTSLSAMERPPSRVEHLGPLPTNWTRSLTLCGSSSMGGRSLQEAHRFIGELVQHKTILVVGETLFPLWRMGAKRTTVIIVHSCGLGCTRFFDGWGETHLSVWRWNAASTRCTSLNSSILAAALTPAVIVLPTVAGSSALEVVGVALDLGREVFVHQSGATSGWETGGSRALVSMGAPVVSWHLFHPHQGYEG
jgi:hypothetical protein